MATGHIQIEDLAPSVRRRMESQANIAYYTTTTLLTTDSATVKIGNSTFKKEKDMLFVTKNGLMLTEGVDYTINSDSTAITRTSADVWSVSPDYSIRFHFIVFAAGPIEGMTTDGKYITAGSIAYNKLDGDFLKTLIQQMEYQVEQDNNTRYYPVTQSGGKYVITDATRPLKAGRSIKLQINDTAAIPSPVIVRYNNTDVTVKTPNGLNAVLNKSVPYHMCYNGSAFISLGEGGGTGNALPADIIEGKSATSSQGAIQGTMKNNGAVDISLAVNGTYTIPAGYHNGSGTVSQEITSKGAATYTPGTTDQKIATGVYLSGDQTIKGDANLIASNIKNGVRIFGVDGTMVLNSGGTAGAAQILEGYTATNDGGMVNGTMKKVVADTHTIGLEDTYTIPQGYHDGAGKVKSSVDVIEDQLVVTPSKIDQTLGLKKYLAAGALVKGDINLSAENIRSGVTLFGIRGTAVPAEGDATPSQVLEGHSYTSVDGFQTGAMTNKGAVVGYNDFEQDFTIPEGYHNGEGYVRFNGATKEAEEFTPGADNIVIPGNVYIKGDQTIKGDPKLIPANIKQGESIFGIEGTAILAAGSALPSQLLAGATASNEFGTFQGTMNKNLPDNITVGVNEPYTIPEGYHDGTGTVKTDVVEVQEDIIVPTTTDQYISAGTYIKGKQTIKGDMNLIPSNIKIGTSIFGVEGTASVGIGEGTATADQVLEGITFSSSKGSNIIGTMPKQHVNYELNINETYNIPGGYHSNSTVYQSVPVKKAQTITPNTVDQVIYSGSYLRGDITVKGEPLLVGSNIVKGVSIFGTDGEVMKYDENVRQAVVLEGKTVEIAASSLNPNCYGIIFSYNTENTIYYSYPTTNGGEVNPKKFYTADRCARTSTSAGGSFTVETVVDPRDNSKITSYRITSNVGAINVGVIEQFYV